MGQFNAYTASQVTLGSSAPVVEQKYPLWVYSSGTASSTATSAPYLLQKGTTSLSGSATGIYTLRSTWSSSQKYALDVSLSNTNSGYTSYAALWDTTSGTIVSASQVSTTSTTSTLLRSGSFTLTPGHSYNVSIWTTSGGVALISKAYLVALFT
jgi:hypothetical protein